MTTTTTTARTTTTLRTLRRRRRLRYSATVAACLLVLLGAFAARVLLGDFTITVPDFFRIITGTDIPVASFVLRESKLPAAVAGVLAGLAFGVAGSIYQTMLRNPLASPDVLGVTVGASAAALSSSVLLGWQGGAMSAAALAGGVAVALLIQLVGGRGAAASHRMVLIGLGLAAALTSLIQWLLMSANIYQAQDALVWLTGSLNSPAWSGITVLAVVCAIGVPIAAYASRSLRLFELGPDVAAGLGLRVGPVRGLLLLVGVVLTATAASVTGPIAFVSLLSGPIARRLLGGRHSVLLAGLVGGIVVVGADYVARYLLPSGAVPVGVVTGAIGAPFLIFLLVSTRSGKEQP